MTPGRRTWCASKHLIRPREQLTEPVIQPLLFVQTFRAYGERKILRQHLLTGDVENAGAHLQYPLQSTRGPTRTCALLWAVPLVWGWLISGRIDLGCPCLATEAW